VPQSATKHENLQFRPISRDNGPGQKVNNFFTQQYPIMRINDTFEN